MGVALKLTAKNQLTLKKEFLQHLGIGSGDMLDVSKLPNGELKIRAVKKQRNIMEVSGLLAGKNSKHFSIDEINEGIASAYAEAGMQGIK